MQTLKETSTAGSRVNDQCKGPTRVTCLRNRKEASFQKKLLFFDCGVFVAVHGLSLVAVLGFLIVVASLVAEHRL